jgi:nicotinate-nucleotide adenylyltransferase
LATFHLLGRWQELLKKMKFLVFPRYGYPNEPRYENMTVISDESLIAINLSSTKIRERVKRGLPIEHFVPLGVAEYIKEHGLYK